MDRFRTIDLFVRILDRGSFTAAAADLGMSRPAATAMIKALEQRLGSRLIERTTRQVRATEEGQEYYRRCRAILADMEAADQALGGTVSGTVRVDVPGNIARAVLLPALPQFLARYPDLTVLFGEGERFVDIVREGFDCVVRAGALPDSAMMARPLGVMEEITCTSPDYLARHGVPLSPDRLDGHAMVGFLSSRTGRLLPLEFTEAGRSIEVSLPARLLVTTGDLAAEAARQGFGLVQAPRRRFAEDLRSGALVEVLEAFRPPPLPLSILYPGDRRGPARVRVLVSWLQRTLEPILDRANTPFSPVREDQDR